MTGGAIGAPDTTSVGGLFRAPHACRRSLAARRVLVPLVGTASLVGWLSASAFAATAYSAQTSYSVGSTTFVDQAFVGYCPGNYGTGISHQNGSYMATSHVGAEAALYAASGAQVFATGWAYNTSPTTYFANVRSWDAASGYYVYASGRTAAWNGNGYTTHPTARTPNVSDC